MTVSREPHSVYMNVDELNLICHPALDDTPLVRAERMSLKSVVSNVKLVLTMIISGQNLKDGWLKLDVNQKVTITILLFLLVALPIGIFLSLNPTSYLSRAQLPSTPPQLNRSPIIVTTTLKDGFLLKHYKSTIEGTDADIGDVLNFRALGLPGGLEIANCNQTQRKVRSILTEIIACRISGISTQKGQFDVELVLYDDKGGNDIKMLQLDIY